jgi:hypothetical protein
MPFLQLNRPTSALSLLVPDMIRAWHGQRLRNLAVAEKLLEAHFDAAEEFLKDSVPSKEAKKFICYASAVCGRKDVALDFAEFLRRDVSPDDADGSGKISQYIEDLKKHRPDLAQLAYTAVSTAVAAMILRWPETEDAVVPLSAAAARLDSSKEFKIQSRGIIRAAQECAA